MSAAAATVPVVGHRNPGRLVVGNLDESQDLLEGILSIVDLFVFVLDQAGREMSKGLIRYVEMIVDTLERDIQIERVNVDQLYQ